MFSPNNQRFTRFDMMQAHGYFRKNHANQDCEVVNGESLYTGPQAFPRMVYWPHEDIIVEGWWEETKQGPKFVGEQKAVRWSTVKSQAEFDAAVELGALDHPALALKKIIETNRANGVEDKRAIPPISTGEIVSKLEAEIEVLRAKLAKAEEEQRTGGEAATVAPPAALPRHSRSPSTSVS